MGMSTLSSVGGWQSTVGSTTQRKPCCDGSGRSSLATTTPTESSLCLVSPRLRTLVICGGVEEQLLQERDIFSTICLALGSHVHGLPSVLVPLWHQDKSIAEIAAIASARCRVSPPVLLLRRRYRRPQGSWLRRNSSAWRL